MFADDAAGELSVQQWLQQVDAATAIIAQRSGQSVLLYQTDSQLFAIWFIALCAQGKHIVLAPDGQPDTIRQALVHCDWQVPDVALPVTTSGKVAAELQLPASAAVSFFTSGSTGQPKLISKTLSQLLLEVQTLERQFGAVFTADTLFCGTVSAQHIYGLLFRILWPLCCERPIYRRQISYLEQWQAILQQQATAFIASPAHLSRFDDIATLKPLARHCRQIFSSGGPLADTVPPRYVEALGLAPTEIYGSTETGGIAFRQRNAVDTAWQAFDGIELGQTAEQALQICSPYLGHGLPYVTQDKVALLSAHTFQLLGRLDRIAKIEEKRLSLPELEQYCLNSPLITQAAAVVLQQGKMQLALVVVLSAAGKQQLAAQGKLALNQQIKQHLLQRFERVLLPRKFRYVAALPFTTQGKLPQRQLEDLFLHD